MFFEDGERRREDERLAGRKIGSNKKMLYYPSNLYYAKTGHRGQEGGKRFLLYNVPFRTLERGFVRFKLVFVNILAPWRPRVVDADAMLIFRWMHGICAYSRTRCLI